MLLVPNVITPTGALTTKAVPALTLPLMVQKLLKLDEIPKPVDSTDALALAICHHWRGAANTKLQEAVTAEKRRLKKVAMK